MNEERASFLERRRRGIGGSDVAPILGLSKYRTALDVYLDKRGLLENEESARMEMGRYLEPAILAWYLDHNAVRKVDRPTFVCDESDPFLMGNFDLEVATVPDGAEVIVDSKNVHFKLAAQWGPEGSDEIPADALMQGHHYLHLRPAAVRVDFVALLGGQWPPRVFSVYRNAFYREIVVPTLREFWSHVEDANPPSPNFADDRTLESVKTLFPPITDKTPPEMIPGTVDVAGKPRSVSELASAHAWLGERIKVAETLRRRVEAALRYAIGDRRAVTTDGATITRVYNRGGERPAFTIAPYDYLRITTSEIHQIEEADVVALLEEGDTAA